MESKLNTIWEKYRADFGKLESEFDEAEDIHSGSVLAAKRVYDAACEKIRSKVDAELDSALALYYDEARKTKKQLEVES